MGFDAGFVAPDFALVARVETAGLALGEAARPVLGAEAAFAGVAAGLAAAGFEVVDWGVGDLAAGAGFALAALDFGAALGLEAAAVFGVAAFGFAAAARVVAAFGLEGSLAIVSPTPEFSPAPAGPTHTNRDHNGVCAHER